MSRVLSNAITLSIVLTFSCRVMALNSIPIPMPKPERPLSIYDLDLKVEGKLPVVANKRNARQTTYNSKPGLASTVRILENRRGMYLIAIYEDGRKLPGEYLISHKWADRILDIDAVLKVAQMNKIIEEATSPKVSNGDCKTGSEEESDEAQRKLNQERLAKARALELDHSIAQALSSDAQKASCMKHSSIDSDLSEGLYDSLVTIFAMKECGGKIKSIRSKIPSKAAFPIEAVSSCAIELNFLTKNQSEGDLEVRLENGEAAILKWKSPEAMPKSQSEWLYMKGDAPGFLTQEGFAKICPALALNAEEARQIALEKSKPTTRGLVTQASAEVDEKSVNDSSPEVALTLSGKQTTALPENIPLPKAKPHREASVTLPANVPIPMPRPERLPLPNRETASTTSNKPLCEMKGVSAQWVKNCEALYHAGIPKDALEYALKVMQLNDDSFQSDKCYKTGPSGHYSMRGVSRGDFERKMSRGLPNKCQMVINDTRDKLGTYRGRMYYIDLCKGSSPKIVKSYFNMGTGTFKNNYADRGGAHTTVKGAFFTNYKTFSFQKNNSAYQAVKSRVKSLSGSYKAPSVQLFGLSTTNNEAGPNLKYMHVSGYKSSWGCPSISPDNYWMIEKLASNGPSLVLNYGTGMEDIKRCSN